MVFVGSPIRIELMAYLTILFLLVCFLNKRVRQELRPGESFARCFVQKTLQERFEFGRHIIRELDWVFHNQVDESVDGICVKWWRTHKQLVDDDTKRPQIDSVVVGQFLNQLRCHIQRRSLYRCKDYSVCGH